MKFKVGNYYKWYKLLRSRRVWDNFCLREFLPTLCSGGGGGDPPTPPKGEGGVATGHKPTPSHFPPTFRGGGGSRTPTYVA